MFFLTKRFDTRRLALPPPPSGHLLPECWKCRGLEKSAAQYSVRTSAYMAWKEHLRKAAGWAMFLTMIVSTSVGLSVLGVVMANGDALEATSKGAGYFICALGMGVLVSTFYLWSNALAKLDVLRREKEY